MASPLILASGSATRAMLLRNAGLTPEVLPARLDEEALRAGLAVEDPPPRDVADTLAEHKARKVSARRPEALVLGCDQVLDLDGRILARPRTPEEAGDQLRALRGRSHKLLSAAVLCRSGAPVWRHIGEARLTMRNFSDSYLEGYLRRGWPGLGETVGAYRLEGEGVRLFARVEGSFFTVLGLPLPEVLDQLLRMGEIDG